MKTKRIAATVIRWTLAVLAALGGCYWLAADLASDDDDEEDDEDDE